MALTISPVTTVAAVEKKEKPESIEYTIKKGDYLDKVAKKYKTSWKRIWDKNGFIKNPDLVYPGDKVMIPSPKEKLKERQLPSSRTPSVTSAPSQSAQPTQNIVSEAFSGPTTAISAGNAYSYGYCTWYVKNLRPDIGSFWGDGSNWYYAAQADGFATGSTPRAGAVGVATGYNHVVYVNSVNGDSVNISEMNYNGWNVVSSRTAPASEFLYIY